MKDDSILMTRLDAIRDIRCGRGIQLTHVGRFSTFRVILRRRETYKGTHVEACIDCPVMRRTYYVKLTSRQVLSYIRRHYGRNLWDEVNVNLDPLPTHYKEVA